MVADGIRSTAQIARYRGRYGQWSWVLHRLSGLGVILFLLLHVIDTSTVAFAPQIYDFFLSLYKNPLFGLGEIGLAAALVYHAVNGVRVTIMDFWPSLWQRLPLTRYFVWIGFAVLFLPIGAVQLVNIFNHIMPK